MEQEDRIIQRVAKAKSLADKLGARGWSAALGGLIALASPGNVDDALLNLEQAVKLAKRSRRTVERWIANGMEVIPTETGPKIRRSDVLKRRKRPKQKSSDKIAPNQ